MKNRVIRFIKYMTGDTKCKTMFLYSLRMSPRLLDVGCGNESPLLIKRRRPDIIYTGIDVGDYNQSEKSREFADRYILSTPESFAEDIASMEAEFDAVISAHNIEHCNHPIDTVHAMCSALKKGGRLCMIFPCEESVSFPSRKGTLNFYDDATHIYVPQFDRIVLELKNNGLRIDFQERRYQPVGKRIIGIVCDQFIKDRVTRFTWAHYGFESIIWATKMSHI